MGNEKTLSPFSNILNKFWKCFTGTLGTGAVKGLFLFIIASRTALGLTHPPSQVPGALSPGAKRPGDQADHSPPSSAEAKNVCGAITPPPPSS